MTEASRLGRTRCLVNARPRIDRPRRIVLVLSEAVLVIVIDGGRDALPGAPDAIIESSGGVITFKATTGLIASTSTIGTARSDERNLRMSPQKANARN